MHFLELKTLHKHQRSARRLNKAKSRASKTIEDINDEIEANIS